MLRAGGGRVRRKWWRSFHDVAGWAEFAFEADGFGFGEEGVNVVGAVGEAGGGEGHVELAFAVEKLGEGDVGLAPGVVEVLVELLEVLLGDDGVEFLDVADGDLGAVSD